MTTVEALQAVLAKIEDLVATANVDGCGEEMLYRVTAGQPAAPVGSCSAVSVWASQYFNAATSLFHEDSVCVLSRGVQVEWRLDVCFTETEQDRTAAQHLADAECVYRLADVIWCGLASSLPEVLAVRCAQIAVDALSVVPALGGIYSVSSGFRFQLDCEKESVS